MPKLKKTQVYREEYPIPSVIIKEHRHFLTYSDKTKNMRYTQRMAITSFDKIRNYHPINALLASYEIWHLMLTILQEQDPTGYLPHVQFSSSLGKFVSGFFETKWN